MHSIEYSKTCVKRPLSKRPKIGFQDQLSLNAGQKYCTMLQHSAILSTFIKLPFVIKIFVLSIFEWSYYTVFTVCFKSLFEHDSIYLVGYGTRFQSGPPYTSILYVCEERRLRLDCAHAQSRLTLRIRYLMMLKVPKSRKLAFI